MGNTKINEEIKFGLTKEQKEDRARITKNFEIFTPEKLKPYVFISYKSNDYKEVLGDIVYKLINEYGLRVYFDNDFLDQNDNWLECMKSAMKCMNCKAVIIFISNNYIKSLACTTELMYTKSNDAFMENDNLGIVAVTLDDIKNDADPNKVSVDSNERKCIVEIIESFMGGNFFKALNDTTFKDRIEKYKKDYSDGKLTYQFMQRCMMDLCKIVNTNELKNETGNEFIKHLYERIKKAASEDVFDESLIGSLDKAKTEVKPAVSAPAAPQSEPIKEITPEPPKPAPVVEKPIEAKAAPAIKEEKVEPAKTKSKSKPAFDDMFSEDYNVSFLARDNILEYQQVEEKFGIRIAGFGRGINSTPSKVVLISSIKKSDKKFVYHDNWTDDGDYLYSGEGKTGDQSMSKGNLAIKNAAQDGKEIHLFVKFSPKEYYYQGVFELADYTYEDDQDESGNSRKEYKFRLKKVR